MKGHFCFVHNNDEARNEYALPRVEKLCEQLELGFSEVHWQPNFEPHSPCTALKRDLKYLWLGILWSRYRKTKISYTLRYAYHYFFSTLKRNFVDRNEVMRWRRRSAIEVLVTSKHVMAWRSFLETDNDFLICCEDDVVFFPESIQRLQGLIRRRSGILKEGLVYIDLAGGLGEDAIKIANLIDETRGDEISYTMPVTNTACAYMMSRRTVEAIVQRILENPSHNMIGIDWMINTIFMELKKSIKDFRCFHFNPTIFGHGTFIGNYVSWQAH